jgi:hypothetical protein
MNQLQHNTLWGQADNLMMVPTDCDNRAERQGWTGDSALTAHEATLNFDMSAFFDNWARMLNDDSPNGAVGCFGAKNAYLLHQFNAILLPRQARDKHRVPQKEMRASQSLTRLSPNQGAR